VKEEVSAQLKLRLPISDTVDRHKAVTGIEYRSSDKYCRVLYYYKTI